MDFTKYEMMSKALEAFGDLVDDEELGPADWPTVKKYTRCLHDAGECNYPHTALENVECMHLSDIRFPEVQAAYWVMLEEGRITQYTANILIQSIDGALDLVSAEPLCDWNGLKSDVQLLNHLKFLQTCTFPQKLVTYILVQRLGSACYISAAFLRAHRIAQRQLHDLIGNTHSLSSSMLEVNMVLYRGLAYREPLISVKSEGPYTVRKNVNEGEISESLIAPRENSGIIDTSEMDYSSDESG
ncbi:hypothetical protein Tco_1517808, partial [Tanacetum coccineum]